MEDNLETVEFARVLARDEMNKEYHLSHANGTSGRSMAKMAS